MDYSVELTDDAERDLEDIFDYVEQRDTQAQANQLLEEIAQVVGSLSQFPNRGRVQSELLDHGIDRYRETIHKSYRIIYEVKDEVVYVLLISDGRREMQDLLFQRVILA
ncbi:MAG: type II toxin-antitoxin system RelE/ParE family toxin [Chloroflexota bacterium]|nr:type II toxin-antitoxin system RelE/ParE family toxin [Chloroflexota bacterium]